MTGPIEPFDFVRHIADNWQSITGVGVALYKHNDYWYVQDDKHDNPRGWFPYNLVVVDKDGNELE